MIQKSLLIFLFTLLYFIGNSQTPIYYKIGEKEFANTDIYTVFFDETSELIYAGTNNGLFIYKENKFTKLKGPKGQLGTSIFELKKDQNGDVFCQNLNGQIFKINEPNNTFEIYYELNEGAKIASHFQFFFTPNNNMFIGSKSTILVINPEKKELHNQLEWSDLDSLIFNIFKQQNGVIYFEANKNTGEGIEKSIFEYKKGEIKCRNKTYVLVNNNSLHFLTSDSNVFSLDMNGRLMYPNTTFENQEFHKKERYFYINENHFLALNTQKGYRSFHLKNDTLNASQLIFPNLFISAVFQTKSNTLLLGTFGDGIIITTHPNIIKKEHKYLFLDIATSPNNNVAVSTQSGEVFNIENNVLKLVDKASIHLDNLFYIGNNYQLNKLGHKDFLYFYPFRRNLEIKDLKIINDSTFICASIQKIRISINNKKAQTTKLDYSLTYLGEKTIHTGEDYRAIEWNPKDSLFFFSTNFGVYFKKWTTKTITPLLYKNELFISNDLLLYNDNLICGTSNHGVLIFNNHKARHQISKREGLNSNNVKELIVKDKLLYILTDKGLNLYDLTENKIIDIKNESIYKDVTDMAMSNDKLWLLEKHSYFSTPLNDLIKTNNINERLNLFINRIEVNNQTIAIKEKTNFSYTENRFEFIYDYRNVFNTNNVVITYTLEGLYSDWRTTSLSNNSILFQSLPPGKYVFKIKALNNYSSSKTFRYEFEILPPFWQSWWFYMLIALFLAGSLILFYRIKIKRINKNNTIKFERQKLLTQSIDSELKAIRSQMNPHFIYNAINSIQDLVLQKDTLQSYDSLVQFSKLVRNTLDYSDQEYILLTEEVNYLTNYLDLEKLRFADHFNFKITNSIIDSLMIPSMIIQPFVENAIKHGLLHKSGNKELSINFTIKNNQLVCSVKDNGVGRERSKEIKARQQFHNSFSTNAIQKRLKVLEQKTGQQFYYKTIDLIAENGKVLGTEIKVFLPVLFKENTVPKINTTVG